MTLAHLSEWKSDKNWWSTKQNSEEVGGGCGRDEKEGASEKVIIDGVKENQQLHHIHISYHSTMCEHTTGMFSGPSSSIY